LISVEVDGKKIELEDGAVLDGALQKAGVSRVEGTAIGIIKIGEKKKEETREYRLETTKGEIHLELVGENEDWMKYYQRFKGARVRWSALDAVAIGTVETDVKPEREPVEYNGYDVLFGTGGYDPKNTLLILCRRRHTSSYGAPREGVFGRVVRGKNVLAQLEHGDRILEIEPIVRWETLAEKISTQDLKTKLEDGMKIFTYFLVELNSKAPEGAEHLLGITRHRVFKADVVSSSFISDNTLQGETCPYEAWDARLEGTVAVRTEGNGVGRCYIYRADRTSSGVHSVVGRVTQGIELVKLARPGDKLHVKTNPERILLLGMSYQEAREALKEHGVEMEPAGYLEDDAIIVKQEPDTTLEILKSGRVKVTGIPPAKLVEVELYDELAPKTLDFFRHSLRLKDRPIGALPVYFTYENTYLFKAEKRAESYKELTPENTPKGVVKAGELAVTNQAAKRYGTIGVRVVDDDKYGPTGEKFEATNIIGRVLELEKLKGLKQGDTLYLKEKES